MCLETAKKVVVFISGQDTECVAWARSGRLSRMYAMSSMNRLSELKPEEGCQEYDFQ